MDYVDLNPNVTEEQIALKENIRKFAAEVLRPASLELDKMKAEEAVRKDSVLWDVLKQLYENGYHKMLFPAELGGLGLDPLSLHIAIEELAYGSLGFGGGVLLAGFAPLMTLMVGNERLIEKYVVPFVNCNDGSIISCLAATEPEHGSDVVMANTPLFKDPNITKGIRAKRVGDEWVINGQTAAWVSNGPIATNAVIHPLIEPSRGMAGCGAFVIDLDQSGVTKGKPLEKMGQRDLTNCEIYFDDAIVPDENMLVGPDLFEDHLDMALAFLNASMGAVFTGMARACYDLAVAYAKERIQGGKPIVEHTNIRMRLFNMFKKVELCRAYSRAAFQYAMVTLPPKTEYSILAKTYTTQACREVGYDAVEIFGGCGIAKEYPIEKLYRDTCLGPIEDGANDTLDLVACHALYDET